MSERLTSMFENRMVVPFSEENQICLTRRKDENGVMSYYYGILIDKLAEFENFMEEMGFESIEDLKDTIKKVDGLILKASQGKRLNEKFEKANMQIRSLEEQLKKWKPKFEIGQEVFIIIDKVGKAKIEKVICTIAKLDDENSTWYSLTDIYGYALRLPEEQVFATREEAEKRLTELERK